MSGINGLFFYGPCHAFVSLLLRHSSAYSGKRKPVARKEQGEWETDQGMDGLGWLGRASTRLDDGGLDWDWEKQKLWHGRWQLGAGWGAR